MFINNVQNLYGRQNEDFRPFSVFRWEGMVGIKHFQIRYATESFYYTLPSLTHSNYSFWLFYNNLQV